MIDLDLLVLDRLVQWDHQLFRWINWENTSDLLDSTTVWIREATHWIPLYVGLLLMAWWKFKTKGLIWIGFGITAVILSDLLGNYAFKHVFERLRPCRDPELMQAGVRLLVEKCGAGYSFVSNHAANHMSLAAFLWTTLAHRIGKWGLIGVFWALSIAYAQIYVGLHFPFDAMVGAMLGATTGSLVGMSFNRQYKNTIFPLNQPNP